MTKLNKCLTTKLDNFSDFGDHKFGTAINACFNDILSLVGSGGEICLSTYDDPVAWELDNVKADGKIFLGTESGTLFYCFGGQWVEIDIGTLAACCETNTLAIADFLVSIQTLDDAITDLQDNLTDHTHDGVDASKIDVKNLDTSNAVAGDIFKADGAGGVICEQPSGGTSLKVSEEGGVSTIDVNCINFDTEFVTVIDQGGGQVDIVMGDLTSLSDDFYSHVHGQGGIPKVPQGGIDSTGTSATQGSHTLCNDGTGCAIWLPKAAQTPDYFVEKYTRTFNQSGVPTTGTVDLLLNDQENLGSTGNVCTQLQAGNTGCVEILATGMYTIDALIVLPSHVSGINSKYYLNMSVTGNIGETQNIAANSSSSQGTWDAHLGGSVTRFLTAGDIVCFDVETFLLASGTSIGAVDTFVSFSKVQ